jgi:hypothetical protein
VAAIGSVLLGVEYSVATVMLRKLNNRTNNKVNIYLSSLMMKVLDHVYVLG